MSKEQQLAKNTLIVALSKVSSVLAVFLVLPIYTRYLSTEDYGFFDLITTYGALLVPIIMLRLEVAIFRWLVDARKDMGSASKVVANIFQIVALCIVVFSVMYWPFALLIDLQYAGLIYGYLVLFALSSVALQVSRGLGRIKEFAIGGIISGVASLSIGAVLILAGGMRLDGVLWGLMLGYALAFMYNAWSTKLYDHMKAGSHNRALKSELVLFSLPMIPNGMSGWATFAGTRIIVSSMIGVAANGVYAVSSKFAVLFSSVYEIFNTTWTESASLHINSPDRDVYFTKIINLAMVFFGSVAILFIAAMPVIFPMLVDRSFAEAYWYIPVSIIGFFFDTITRMIGAIYVALRLTKQVMYTTIAAAVVSIIGTIALIPHIGLWGAVIASSFALMGMSIFRYVDIRRHGVKIDIHADGLVMLLIGFFAVTTAYYIEVANVIVHISIILLAGLFTVYLNRGLMKQGVSVLKGARKRISR